MTAEHTACLAVVGRHPTQGAWETAPGKKENGSEGDEKQVMKATGGLGLRQEAPQLKATQNCLRRTRRAAALTFDGVYLSSLGPGQSGPSLWSPDILQAEPKALCGTRTRLSLSFRPHILSALY